MKNNKKLLVVALLLTLVVIIGTTYAWLNITKKSEIVNKITAGNLELILDDTTSEGIKLEKAVPMSERQGKSTQKYTFTLTNKGTTNVDYTLYLDDLDLSDNETRIEDDKIRYKLVRNNGIVTQSSTISTIKFVEGNYLGSFDSSKHKFTSVADNTGSNVEGLMSSLNDKLTEDCTALEAFDVFKNYFGTSYTYETKTPSESALLSTTGTNPNRKLDLGMIKPGRTNTYSLQVWIDSKAENDIMYKIFYTELRVSATQSGPVPVCKRAATLHTEVCTRSYCVDEGYTSGGEITYGNKTTTDGVLSTGDAFDCDVNGDGIYDAETERFYYVTDLDSKVAVLTYYNNVSEGKPLNTASSAYSEAYQNNQGPSIAIKQLPTTSQWSNVSLTNQVIAIVNEKGGNTTDAGILNASFSYSGYAARLLTLAEVKKACYTDADDNPTSISFGKNCEFFAENTSSVLSTTSMNGFWLETPMSSSSYIAWGSTSSFSFYASNDVSNGGTMGTRPAIEVAKSSIEY